MKQASAQGHAIRFSRRQSFASGREFLPVPATTSCRSIMRTSRHASMPITSSPWSGRWCRSVTAGDAITRFVLRLPVTTPPGTYRGALHIGEQTHALEAIVDASPRLSWC